MRFFPPVSFATGAYHASELQYLFDLAPGPVPAAPLDAAQQQLADAMQGYWTRFAENGNPNAASAPAWPTYDTTQQFQSLLPPTPLSTTGFAADHKCALWGG
jgi:para-nitrobenzyl esterase